MRVAVIDDSALFRRGLAALLRPAGVEVCAERGSAEGFAGELDVLVPDAVLLDIRMPPSFHDEGLTAAAEIKRQAPSVGVLVLSTYAESHYVTALLGLGSDGIGYLLKDRVDDTAMLVDALRRVVGGGCVVDPHLVAGLVSQRRHRVTLEALSDREREVLERMAAGLSNQGISAALHISLRTVENHAAAIFAKLELPNTPDANRRVRAVPTYLRGTGT